MSNLASVVSQIEDVDYINLFLGGLKLVWLFLLHGYPFFSASVP